MTDVKFLTREELEAGLPNIRQAPKNEGDLKLIVRCPKVDAREVLTEAHLDLVEGLSELAKVFGKKLRQGNAGKGMETLSRRCDSLAGILLLTVFLQKTFANSLSQRQLETPPQFAPYRWRAAS